MLYTYLVRVLARCVASWPPFLPFFAFLLPIAPPGNGGYEPDIPRPFPLVAEPREFDDSLFCLDGSARAKVNLRT